MNDETTFVLATKTLTIALDALKEAAKHKGCDDCNGRAGEIAQEALDKIFNLSKGAFSE